MRTATMLLVPLIWLACAPSSISPIGYKDGMKIGYTECTPVGVFYWVRGDVQGNELTGVHAHERKHVEQFRRHPNCREATAWYLMNTADAEAEAFCAHATAMAGENPIGPYIVQAARTLSERYPDLRISFPDALLRISKHCAV